MIKIKIIVTLFVMFILSCHASAKSLKCIHYLNVNVHDSTISIIRWQEDVRLDLGTNDKALRLKLEQQQVKAETIKTFINGNQKERAIMELGIALQRKINPADSMENLLNDLNQSATVRKVLLPKKNDDYSEFSLDLVTTIEKVKEEVSIVEGIEFKIVNKISKITSTYYHAMSTDGLVMPDSNSNILGEMKEELKELKVKSDNFGEIHSISYKCLYPSIPLTSTQTEQEYIKTELMIQEKLRMLRAKMKSESEKVKVQEKENVNKVKLGPTGGSTSD